MNFTITIQPGEQNQRIDFIAYQHEPSISRSQWQKYGHFAKEEQPNPGKTKTRTGEIWAITYQPKQVDELAKPWDYPLDIIQETNDWAVINKPAGISVHPSLSETSNQTLVNALIHHYGENLAQQSEDIDGITIPKLGIVHRLDKTTSGLILIAKNLETLQFFQANWSHVNKYYLAIVQGVTPKKGIIEAGIIRHPHQRLKMTVSDGDGSKPAKTEFERLEILDGNKSLLKVKLHTGRTHQIRVHLSSIGFPVAGDTLYEGPEDERIMLHAAELNFSHKEKNFALTNMAPFA